MGQTRRMRDGDRMLIPCSGGPAGWRATLFPPPIELVVDDEADHGIYVLIDDGPPEQWSYEFVRECVRS